MATEQQHEERVRVALVEALRAIEGPDRGRLARIERQLLIRRRRRSFAGKWWPLLGLGLALGATAAWWSWPLSDSTPAMPAGEVVDERDAVDDITPVQQGADDGDPDARDGDPQEDGSPVIYIGE